MSALPFVARALAVAVVRMSWTVDENIKMKIIWIVMMDGGADQQLQRDGVSVHQTQ
jgi:hypothetical protein